MRPLCANGIRGRAEIRCDTRYLPWGLRVLHVSAGACFSTARPLPGKLVRTFSLRAMPVALVGQRGRSDSGKGPDVVTTLHPHDWSVACRPFCHDCRLGCTIPLDRCRGEGTARGEIRFSAHRWHGSEVFDCRVKALCSTIWPLLLLVVFGSLPPTPLECGNSRLERLYQTPTRRLLMAFCNMCGAQIADGSPTCPPCRGRIPAAPAGAVAAPAQGMADNVAGMLAYITIIP